MQEKLEAAMPVTAKVGTVWGGVFAGSFLNDLGIQNWSDMSYALASLLSLLFIVDWFWKRFWRDIFVRLGWVKPKLRRRDDFREVCDEREPR